MSWQNSFIAACLFVCVLTIPAAVGAEPGTQARAQVLSRQLASGERLIFSWDSHQKVPFSVETEKNKVFLYFERPVSLRWKAAREALTDSVRKIETLDGGTTVVLTLNQPADAEYYEKDIPYHFEPDKNGIDLLVSKGDTQELPRQTGYIPSATLKKKPYKLARRKSSPGKTLAKAPLDTTKSEAARLSALAPAAGATEPSVPATSGEPVPVTPAETTALVAPAPSSAPAPAASTTPTEPVPAATVAAPVAESAPAEAPAAAAVAVAEHAAAPVTPTILPLPIKTGEPFAAFMWNGKLWLVAPNSAALTADALRKAGGTAVTDVHEVTDPHAAIFSLSLQGDMSASVEKAGETTQLRLSSSAQSPAQTLHPIVKTAAGKAGLEIPAAKNSAAVSFQDPQTGQMMNVITIPDTGAGIATPYSLIELRLLASAQGIAVESLSDAVSVALENGTVKIASPSGLTISPPMTRQLQDEQSQAALSHIPPTLFPYARWKLEDEKEFVPVQVALMQDIALGTPDAANKARLKLLGLFLSEGLFPEAAGMADDILRNSLKFYRANHVAALRGAAYLLQYHVGEADRDFASGELGNDPEIAFWRALCKELLGQDNQVFHFTENYERYIRNYPPVFIEKLAIIAADRSINRHDYDEANAIFDTLKRDGFDEPVKKYITYMQGKILSETHNETEAAALWEQQAKEIDDPLIRARAEFSLINMQVKSGKMSHDEATKQLEKLRIVWRGDSIELGVLTLLSTLYQHDKQYDKALHTMRDIVTYYPQVPEAIDTARQMEEIFVLLYNKGGADTMPPLDALALFFEFRDLVPIGKEGDQMIRNLADRLVSIDLLDRAAMLLDHQIHNRLEGEERSRVGAHLANVYLLNHMPDKALDILKTTGYGDLPSDLELMRIRLTARALAQQGKVERAISVISTDTSTDGTALRLSIYWENKDWPNVVTIAEDILGNRNDPSAALTPQESDVLLKLATAYVYEHDAGQLQYLRDYFTPLMKNNPNQASFQFITSESGTVNYDNLSSLDQEISSVKSFLASTQEKPGKNGMSN